MSVSIETGDNPDIPAIEGIGTSFGTKRFSDLFTMKYLQKWQNKQSKENGEKKTWDLQRSVSRKYNMNKEGVRYKKTSNIVKREKELLKISKRLTNIHVIVYIK